MYGDLVSANPSTPVMVRESEGVVARLRVTLPDGNEAETVVDGLDAKGVGAALAGLVGRK